MMGWPRGFEPPTTGITIQDSTAELRPPLETATAQHCIRCVQDLVQNLEHLACPTGLEPVTLSLEG